MSEDSQTKFSQAEIKDIDKFLIPMVQNEPTLYTGSSSISKKIEIFGRILQIIGPKIYAINPGEVFFEVFFYACKDYISK